MSDSRNDPKPKPAHADLVWTAAVAAAKNMMTITYGEITQPLGLGRGLSIRYALGYIETTCRRLGLPPLNVIVVNAKTRRPGSWVTLGEPAWRALVLAVYAFPWDTVSLPSALPEEAPPTEDVDEEEPT